MITGFDLTLRAVRRWIAALPADHYDLRLVHAEHGSALLRRFAPAQLLHALHWMRAMNARGWHVYARPLSPWHILVDDLCCDAVANLRTDHAVAALVETSSDNYQAWVTIASHDPDPALASAVARRLAAAYGGDPGAANHAQVGRLPGFVNRKWKHERGDGSYPFVLLHYARACVDPNGVDLLRAVEAAVAPAGVQAALARVAKPPMVSRSLRARDAATEHAAGMAALRARLPPGAVLDRSRADHAIALRLLRRGAPVPFVAAVLRAGEKAAGRSGERAAGDYVARTVAAAVSAAGAPPAAAAP